MDHCLNCLRFTPQIARNCPTTPRKPMCVMISIVWGGVALYNNYSNYANTTHPIPGKFCFCKMPPIPGNIQIWHSKQLAIFFWLDYMQLHSFYGIASNSAVFINHSTCTSVSNACSLQVRHSPAGD